MQQVGTAKNEPAERWTEFVAAESQEVCKYLSGLPTFRFRTYDCSSMQSSQNLRRSKGSFE
jgi:hypothetical protein